MTVKLERSRHGGDRYYFDFERCKDWAQMDTKSDAYYYGQWACPIKRELMSFTEGDVVHTTCDTDAEFIEEVNKLIDWQKNNETWIGIDWGFNEAAKKRWQELGFIEKYNYICTDKTDTVVIKTNSWLQACRHAMITVAQKYGPVIIKNTETNISKEITRPASWIHE